MPSDREIELKLEAGSADLRRLQRHPLVQGLAQGRAVTRVLDSVYFDTEDDALAGAGFGLRIRRVGTERVQTVKGERSAAGGLSDRLEVECPIDADVPDLERIPDEALAARLREVIGGRALVPIFRTTFQRARRVLSDSEAEWTLDVDEGEVVAGDERVAIHEIELELRSGEASRLLEFALTLQEHFDVVPAMRSKAERGYALARGRGAAAFSSRRVRLAPDASVEAALEATVAQTLGHFTANAACAAEGLDPEGVHQMRIGARRARAALSVFGPLLPERTTRVLRSELRWLGHELGAARDLDVFTRELLPPLALHREHDPAFKRLRDEALALRADCYAVVREVLRSPRHARLVLELGVWLHTRGWRNQPLSENSARLFGPARPFAAELLERRHHKVSQLAKHLADSDEARHALRIQLKKLRYSGEFFRDLFPEKPAKKLLRRAARLSSALGGMNDVATAHGILEVLLARLGEERSSAHDRAAGFIEGWTTQLADGGRAEVAAAWKRLRRTRRFWRD